MELIVNERGLLKDPEQGIYADDNIIYPFRNRTINKEKPIYIYRNLTMKGRWYSIRQSGRVVARAKAICMTDCEFMVNEKGRERVRKTRHKEVHAFIKGYYTTSGMGTTAAKNDLPVKIEYNPLVHDQFIATVAGLPFKPKGAWFIICNKDGVRASYTF